MNATFTEVVPDHPFRWVDGKPPYFEFTSVVTRIHAGDSVEVPIRLDARDSRYERLKQLYDRCLYFEGQTQTLQAQSNGQRMELEALRREVEQLRMERQTVEVEETAGRKRKGQ